MIFSLIMIILPLVAGIGVIERMVFQQIDYILGSGMQVLMGRKKMYDDFQDG